MRFRAGFLALAVVMVPPAAPVEAGDSRCIDAADFVHVPGQGPSCRLGQDWRVLLQDGSTILTHGPDPVPGPDAGDAFDVPRAPLCVPEDEPHQRVIYARSVDRADRYATMAPQIRSMVARANGMLFSEAAEFGAVRDVKALCDGDGEVHVDHAVLLYPSPLIQFSLIVSELKRQGFTSDLAKYWVWYDRSGLEVGLPGGQAQIESDDRNVFGNANNGGGHFAVTYGYTGGTGAFIMLHEGGHTLGAVQHSSPNSSGGFHCNDGQDVMCYADGGSTSNYDPNVCAVQHFDCNHDDYFHPDPAPGSYLATHWNLGSGLLRFLSHPGAGPPPPDPGPGCVWTQHGGQPYWASVHLVSSSLPHFGEDVPVPADCPGTAFQLTATLPTADFDVCWLWDGLTLACHENPGPEAGVIPVGANMMRVMLRQGAVGEYDLTAPPP